MDIEQLRNRVLAQIDLSKEVSDDEVIELIEEVLSEISRTRYISLHDRSRIGKELFHSLRKLDILQDLLEDPGITEIMINGPEQIFIEQKGALQRLDRRFISTARLEDIVQQMVSGANRIVNESVPIADARLEDGSRVNVVLSPVVLKGPAVTIRKFPQQRMRMQDLLDTGALTEEIAVFLHKLVIAGYNLFISGGTGSGKTTFLNVLSDYIPADERVIVIEDSTELQMTNPDNLVQMECRNANVEGCQEISIRDLIRTSLRMRPDRIIIGEIRGPEAIDLLQAVNTGHDGSFSTGHANSAEDMLSRMETMVIMGMDIPLPAVRRQIAAGFDLIIHLGRLRDRSRKILKIIELCGYREGEIICSSLFEFVETGEDRDGKVKGIHKKTGELENKRKLFEAGLSL